jgi:hypothetical protein
MEPANRPVEEEMAFADGNVTGAVRVGGTVRRNTGPWTPAIHALLRHLERVGFPGAPHVLGIDGRGREMLTYVEGETDPDPRVSFHSDEALAEAARLLRLYHDATVGFAAPAGAAWRLQVGAPAAGEVICHNDVAPYNTVVAGGRPVAFIDWDFAAPGPREWDIAHALWRFTPLYDGEEFGSPSQQAQRMAAFCDAYGLGDRRNLVATIERRQRVLYESLRTWAAAGDPAFAAMWHEGHGEGVLRDISHIRRHRVEFGRVLRAE